MTDRTPPALPSRPASQDVRPTALQAVVTLVGGLVLAAGTCAGFLGTLNLNRDSTVNVAFALGFFASLIAAGVGLVLVIVRQVKLMNRRRASALEAGGAVGTALPGVAPAPGGPASGSRAWKPVVLGAALLAAAVVFVVLLVATDPNPIAIVFLLLAAASGLGSIVSLLVAVIRYGRGR